MCSRNRYHTLRKHVKTATLRPDCRCWKCGECRPGLKNKWIQHAAVILAACGLYLGTVTIDADDYASFRRKLNRKGGKHFRVRLLDNGKLGMIIGMPTNPIFWTFRASALSEKEAIELFTKWVNDIHSSAGGNPISSSRSWALPQRNHSEWEVIAVGPTPSQVRIAAGVVCGERIQCQERNIHGLVVTICQGTSAGIDELCERVAAMSQKSMTQMKEYTEVDTDVIGIALEDFQPCGDGYFSGRVLMT